MTPFARIVAVTTPAAIVAMTALAGSATAQTPLFEVENSEATKLLQVGDDAGFAVTGTFGQGTIPVKGQGVRLMWYPGKAAFRVGYVSGSQWDDENLAGSSIALGVNTIANGGNSVALGTETTASGGNSTALGRETKASGSGSTAMGFSSTAGGFFATAMGAHTDASGDNSTAMGETTRAVGLNSTAMGSKTVATGENSTAMGAATVASGNYSTAMGFRGEASGAYSTAMGFDTHATGVSSTAMGAASTAAGLGSVAIGTRAVAQGAGSFVFADRSSTTEPYTASDNQFLVRAHGGIGLNSGTNIGCDLPAGVGSWACTSSRLAKEGFEDVDGEWVLGRLAGIRVQRWRYLGTSSPHVGPTAEDFQAAFGLGESSTKIATVDADGIALRAVQALEQRTAASRHENTVLQDRVTALEAELAGTRAQLAELRSWLEALGGDRHSVVLPGRGGL